MLKLIYGNFDSLISLQCDLFPESEGPYSDFSMFEIIF